MVRDRPAEQSSNLAADRRAVSKSSLFVEGEAARRLLLGRYFSMAHATEQVHERRVVRLHDLLLTKIGWGFDVFQTIPKISYIDTDIGKSYEFKEATSMGRKRKWVEDTVGRFAEGTFARIAAAWENRGRDRLHSRSCRA